LGRGRIDLLRLIGILNSRDLSSFLLLALLFPVLFPWSAAPSIIGKNFSGLNSLGLPGIEFVEVASDVAHMDDKSNGIDDTSIFHAASFLMLTMVTMFFIFMMVFFTFTVVLSVTFIFSRNELFLRGIKVITNEHSRWKRLCNSYGFASWRDSARFAP